MNAPKAINRNASDGFTLLEIMIVVAIMGVMLAVGAPALSAYMTNAKILASAQSVLGGLQEARAEAVRRNSNANFVLTSSTSLNDPSAAADGSGTSWLISVPDPITPSVRSVVNSKSSKEGSGDTIVVSANSPSIMFTSLGATNLTAPAIFQFMPPAGNTCGGNFRCINVVVTSGGRTQLCDPAIASSAIGDSRRCITS